MHEAGIYCIHFRRGFSLQRGFTSLTDRIPSPSLTSSLFRSSSRAKLLAKALSCLLDSVDRTEELKLSSSGGGRLLREERKPIFYSNVSLQRDKISHKATSADILLSYREICPALKSSVRAQSKRLKMK